MTPDVITLQTILDGAEYDVRPELGYEIAAGVVARLRPPTEAAIEAYDTAAEKSRAAQEAIEKENAPDAAYRYKKAVRQGTTEMARAALQCDADVWDKRRGDLIYPVIERASTDFFFLHRPKPSKQSTAFVASLRGESDPSKA